MAAGNKESKKRKGGGFLVERSFAIFVLSKRRDEMAFHMVDGNDWEIKLLGELFNKSNTGFKSGGKTWSDGDGEMSEVFLGEAGGFESFLIGGLEKFLVFAFGKMRNDTAKLFVKFNLRSDDIGKSTETVRNGDGSFIARSVDGENGWLSHGGII